MDPAIRRGFGIGFLLVAAVAGAFAWRGGWVSKPETKRAEAPAAMTPPEAGEPKAETPNTESPKAEAPASSSAPDTQAQGSPHPAAPGVPKGEAPQPGSPDAKGAFDVVRVEPSGDTVVAGRCAADCTAELTVNGKPQDKATADAAGNFVMAPPALPPGDHQLGLKVTTPDGRQSTSEQTVTVSVPEKGSKEVVVVLNEPDAPSKILQQPGRTPAAANPGERPAPGDVAARDPSTEKPAATPAQKVAALSLGAIDAEDGRFFIQGTAPSGAKLRVYLNNSLLAEPVAGADERWSLRVERGLTPGRYVARVDHVDAAGKVVTRAEQAFGYAAEVAAAAPKPEPPKPGATARGATPPAAGGAADMSGQGPKTSSGTATSPPAAAASREPSPSSEASGRSAAAPGTGETEAATPPTAPGAASSERSADRGPPAVAAAPASSTAGGSTPQDAGAGAQAASEPEAAGEQAAAAPARPLGAVESPSPPAGDAANPVVALIDTAQVKRGDSLWRISRATYGRGMRYTTIFTANDSQIRNPNLIYPGQVFVLPADKTEGAADASRR